MRTMLNFDIIYGELYILNILQCVPLLMPSEEKVYEIPPDNLYAITEEFFENKTEYRVVQKVKNRSLFAIGGRDVNLGILAIGIVLWKPLPIRKRAKNKRALKQTDLKILPV